MAFPLHCEESEAREREKGEGGTCWMTEKGEYNSAKGGCQSIGCLIAACHADTVSEQKAAGKKPKRGAKMGTACSIGRSSAIY